MFGGRLEATSIKCKRDNIFGASEVDWMEWQAGYVCGAVLMPHTRIKAIAKEHFESTRQRGPLGDKTQAAADLIGRVVKAFQVSADAARVRMLKLTILSEVGRGLELSEPGA
jgi:Zn-dependent peptidase ImmA (M78 family)